MPQPDFQTAFFTQLLTRLPASTIPEKVIATLLHISSDTALALLKGNIPLTPAHLKTLAVHYKISVDQILWPQHDAYVFHGRAQEGRRFDTWLDDIYQQLTWFNTFSNRQITFLAKDLPFLSHLLLPELAAFKFFYWQKSILHYENLRGKKFSVSHSEQYDHETGRKIISLFNRVSTTEIWSEDSINSTLRQIDFYRSTGIFESDNDALFLYEKVIDLLNHTEEQAAKGVKFDYNTQPGTDAVRYELFINSLVLGDNTLFAELDNMSITYLNHSVLNYLTTMDTGFNDYMKDVLQHIIRKSVKISTTGAEERTAFFSKMREKVRLAAALPA